MVSSARSYRSRPLPCEQSERRIDSGNNERSTVASAQDVAAPTPKLEHNPKSHFDDTCGVLNCLHFIHTSTAIDCISIDVTTRA